MFTRFVSPRKTLNNPCCTCSATPLNGSLPATLLPSLLQKLPYTKFAGGGAIVTVGEDEYPLPALFIVMLVTAPPEICAVADAPEPVESVIVTAGATA